MNIAVGTRVTTKHFGRIITGTVVGFEPRGIFSVKLYQVDWDEFGLVWESPASLTVAE